MKRLIHIVVLTSTLLLAGCSDFLDRTPISNMNEKDFYKTESDFQIAIRSAYNSLYILYGPEGLPSYFGELMSDNAYSDNTAGNVQDNESFENHTMNPSNSLVTGFWNEYYKALYIINNILAQSAGGSFNSKASLEGEAKFLRALFYFDMTRAWGDVPLVLTPLSVKEALQMGRTQQAKVYEQIVDDLKFAAENLPDKKSERFAGAATSNAAHTLLGKVYLTLGNKESAKEVLLKEYGQFTLVPYADLWDLTKKNNAESIFEIQYKGGKSNPYSKYWSMFTPLDNRIITVWGSGMNQVSDDLWNAYEPGDARRDLSIGNGYTTAQGDVVNVKYCIKWKDEKAELDGLRESADNNFIILRYADVLLMLTEATGDVKYLNEVRDRTGLELPHYGAAGYPTQYNTVALACEHERQVEFAMEFHRWFDLIRTGRAISVIKNCSKNVTIQEQNLLLPIPLDVITQNPDMITQNEAYR